MNQQSFRLVLLGLGHGLNDCIAGYFLGCLVLLNIDALQIGLGLLLYNLLAFGGQYPVALLLEKMQQPKKMLIFSYALNLSAIILFDLLPQFSIVLAGIASAIYHVAGGSISAEKNRAASIGIFAAPGVAGLVAGGYFAYSEINILYWLLAGAIAFLFYFFVVRIDTPKSKIVEERKNNFHVDSHDVVMMLLLVFISFRSVIWNIFQLVHERQYDWLIAIAAAAFVGKLAGGWLADKIGWKLYSIISLVAAMPLLSFFKKEMVLFTIGIGFPATTSLLITYMKSKTERAIGLSFGTTIMAGAIVFYTPARAFLLNNLALAALGLVMLAILYFVRKPSNLHS
ncbi:MAG: hypothetical protein C4308_04435 [Chitinophagaceae bacterium]